MAPLHRSLVASLPKRSTPSSLVALDGSYDFQTNRAEMGEKIAVFFRSKVGVPTTVVGLPETERPGADLAPTAFSATLAALDAANILFLGPGSPSRAAMRCWRCLTSVIASFSGLKYLEPRLPAMWKPKSWGS